MINNTTKKGLFIIAGLAVIAIAVFIGKSNNVHATKKEGTKFDDWVVACSPKDEKTNTPELCLLTQQINLNQDDKTQVLAVYKVGYFGENKELKIIQMLPLGVSLVAGTSIVAEKELIISGKYTVCNQVGCQAVADISPEDLKKFVDNKETSVAFVNASGEVTSLPISSKGLEKGLDFLKK